VRDRALALAAWLCGDVEGVALTGATPLLARAGRTVLASWTVAGQRGSPKLVLHEMADLLTPPPAETLACCWGAARHVGQPAAGLRRQVRAWAGVTWPVDQVPEPFNVLVGAAGTGRLRHLASRLVRRAALGQNWAVELAAQGALDLSGRNGEAWLDRVLCWLAHSTVDQRGLAAGLALSWPPELRRRWRVVCRQLPLLKDAELVAARQGLLEELALLAEE
jgi:hypothetical protein